MFVTGVQTCALPIYNAGFESFDQHDVPEPEDGTIIVVSQHTHLHTHTDNPPTHTRLSYRELSEVARLRVVVGGGPPPPEPSLQPDTQVPQGLGAGDEVAGGGQRAPFVKVAHPQLGAGKLPLYVCMVLNACSSVNTIQYKLY